VPPLSQKQIFTLKQKIHTILPIILAIFLPILSFYTNEQMTASKQAIVLASWPVYSLILYFLWYLLWNLWDLRRKYRDGKYLLRLATCFACVLGGMFLMRNHPETSAFFSLTRPFLGIFIFLVIQYTLRSQGNIARLQVEKERIQTESYKAQLQVLHAKIDPHFLFNSLNTLRSMVRQGHEHSEKFILSLSDFYRQMLQYNENTKLRLAEELSILESYLFLMKNRNEEAVFVDMTIDRTLHSFFVPTLALQTVVENCFKHNSMTSSMPLHIEITSTNDGYIEVKNDIQPKFSLVASTGKGLDLLIKRYELMGIFDGVHIEESPDQFQVKLKLIP